MTWGQWMRLSDCGHQRGTSGSSLVSQCFYQSKCFNSLSRGGRKSEKRKPRLKLSVVETLIVWLNVERSFLTHHIIIFLLLQAKRLSAELGAVHLNTDTVLQDGSERAEQVEPGAAELLVKRLGDRLGESDCFNSVSPAPSISTDTFRAGGRVCLLFKANIWRWDRKNTGVCVLAAEEEDLNVIC